MVDKEILSMLQKKECIDQGQIIQHLSFKGYRITQSALSRRLKKLGIVKVNGAYYKQDKPARIFSGVKSLAISSPNIVVIKTLPGHAQGVAYQLEKVLEDQIAGMIAGDDTLFVTTKKEGSLEDLAAEMRALMFFNDTL